MPLRKQSRKLFLTIVMLSDRPFAQPCDRDVAQSGYESRLISMQCPECNSTYIRKNGIKKATLTGHSQDEKRSLTVAVVFPPPNIPLKDCIVSFISA
jgi:hypothetical protein